MATLILAVLFLALFFSGRDQRYGPLNDIFSAVTLLLLILPAIGVYLLTRDTVGVWIIVITWLAIAGIVIAAIGQLLLVLGLISLPTSFVTGGVGILPVLAWMVSIAILDLYLKELAKPIGWLTIAVLALIILLTAVWGSGKRITKRILGGTLTATLVVWFGMLGWYFISM
jgi:hypothetical protein